MKSSTIIFNAAAILALLAILVGLVQLVKNKQTVYGVETGIPVAMPAVTEAPALVPDFPTSAPVTGVSDPTFNWELNRQTTQPVPPAQLGNQFPGSSAYNPFGVPPMPGQSPMMGQQAGMPMQQGMPGVMGQNPLMMGGGAGQNPLMMGMPGGQAGQQPAFM